MSFDPRRKRTLWFRERFLVPQHLTKMKGASRFPRPSQPVGSYRVQGDIAAPAGRFSLRFGRPLEWRFRHATIRSEVSRLRKVLYDGPDQPKTKIELKTKTEIFV